MRSNAKGLSKPNEEPNLKSMVRAKITSDLIFKDGSKIVDVVTIEEVNYLSIKKGEYSVPSIKDNRQLLTYDYELCGDAQIEFNYSNLHIVHNHMSVIVYYPLSTEPNIPLF